jgi:hypothetical protein
MSDALLSYLDASARDPAVPMFFSSYFSSSPSLSSSLPTLSLGLGSH